MIKRAAGKISLLPAGDNRPQQTALAAALLVCLILLAFWWPAGRWYQRQLTAEKRSEAALEVTLRGNVLSSILTRRFARLQSLYALAQAEPSSESLAVNFEPFAAALYQNSSGIRNFAIAPGGVVRFVYPFAGNESVIGYAPLDDPRPQVRADALRAIETGEIIVSGPVALIQGGQGIIVRQAVYKDGVFWGLVNLALDLPDLLTEAGVNQPGGNLEFALRDGRGQIIYGSPAIFTKDPVLNTVELPEGVWELVAAPREGWEASIRRPLLLFQVAGLVILGLVSSLVYLSVNRQSRLASAVQQRTRELSTANLQLVQSHSLLEQRVQERTRALSTLLDVSFNLASTLELEPLLETILDQLENVVGYSGAAILLLEDDRLVTAVQRGPQPPILGQLSPAETSDQPARQLRNYWEETGWSKPILSNFNNPLAASGREAAQESALEEEETGPSWMGVPLKSHDLLIGAIVLGHDDPEYYTARHGQLVMVVANQAAVSIDKARLYQQARHLAVLQERQRLARELHDSVSQALYGIALGARTAHTLLSRDPEKAAEPLNYVLSLSEAALTEMRALIFELRPESLEKEGLIAALERQAQVLQSRHQLEVETKLGEEPAISLPLKEALYRVAQEATHNIVKHAAAKKVQIHLQQQDGRLVLEIRDDGRGFHPQDPFPGHFGLHSMRERVERAGGSLIIESSPGQGTCIQATLRE